MKNFLPISSLFVAVLATAAMFTSCQKETPLTPKVITEQPGGTIGDRGPAQIMYGVTVFSAGNPSQLVTMDPVNETVLANIGVTVNGVAMNDLKGVCTIGQEVYVTTGPHAIDAYSNVLLNVNPQTGVGVIVSYSTVGTVSDIDYNPVSGNITGLLNNSNRLVTINGVGFPNYALANFTLPFGTGYTARGLTWVNGGLVDANQLALKIATATGNTTTGGPIQYYEVPAAGGAATLEAAITPNAQLAGGNCGLGYMSYISNIGRVFINKNASTDANTGLNRFDHAIPLANPTASAATNIYGFNFEDLSTTL